MLVIRLQRTGRSNTPTYRIVVAEKSDPVKAKSLEIIGHYLPARNPVQCEIKEERIQHWLKLGAQPSDTLARLLSRNGVKGLERFHRRYSKQKSKSASAEAAPATAA